MQFPSRITNENNLILPEYSIPSESETALHPLISFFEGDAPQWSHIQSGGIQKTHYYNKISDKIDEGRNLFIIGIPASGKTTLMMQLIYSYPSQKPKHYLISPSLNEVKLYLKKIGTNPVLLFVDNCFRDYLSVMELLEVSNVQLVCVDRDYSYESQIYRIREVKRGFDVIDITEIDDKDARKIVDSIPSGVKKRYTTIYGSDKTIYSVLVKNMKAKRFEYRFKKMIKEFYKENPIATELFILICYVHACGVPVSYDMIFSYLSDLTNDYRKIYKYIKEVGNIIIECGDDTFSFLNVNLDDQDYYQSRSTYFAEQIMNNLPQEPNVLKKVLSKFIANVPAFQICRFDIFKRHGFDSDFALKAFDDIEEGKSYYEKCTMVDESEYIYQQAALYFSKKREYTLAFHWIEKARNFATFNRFSIDNTHAIIQFNANIEIEDDKEKTVRKLLEDSLDMLKNCYTNDRRKNVHVLAFANLSIKFYNRFKSDLALEYLQLAKKWLESEMDGSDCGYRMKKDMKNIYLQIQKLL